MTEPHLLFVVFVRVQQVLLKVVAQSVYLKIKLGTTGLHKRIGCVWNREQGHFDQLLQHRTFDDVLVKSFEVMDETYLTRLADSLLVRKSSSTK